MTRDIHRPKHKYDEVGVEGELTLGQLKGLVRGNLTSPGRVSGAVETWLAAINRIKQEESPGSPEVTLENYEKA